MKNNNYKRIRMGLRVKPAMTSSPVRICSAMTSSSGRIKSAMTPVLVRITSGMTLFTIICLLIGQSTLRPIQANAQISIGSANDSVTVGSVLDLSQGSGGLLLPQVSDTIVATRTAGMMVFSLADSKVYTYNGVTSTWVAF